MTCERCGAPIGGSSRRGLCKNCWTSHRNRVGWSSRYVSAEPVREHIYKLKERGLGLRRISELSGVNRKQLLWITTGRAERGTGPSEKVLDTTADRVLAIPVPDTDYERSADHQLVHTYGTNRRLQALVAIGYTQTYLSYRMGISMTNATKLFIGPKRVQRGRRPRVTAATARMVKDLYNELQETTGPSDRARGRALKLGWLPPIAWDDDTIDQPLPWLNRQMARTLRQEYEAPQEKLLRQYEELREVGFTTREIGAKVGMSEEELRQTLNGSISRRELRARHRSEVSQQTTEPR